MKVFDSEGNEIKGSFSFQYAGAEISITTTTRLPEVAVFFEDGSNRGPFHTIADAMRIALPVELEKEQVK